MNKNKNADKRAIGDLIEEDQRFRDNKAHKNKIKQPYKRDRKRVIHEDDDYDGGEEVGSAD